ncbi:MAG TPA: hypothetical protein VGN97_12165 [Mesorhizobium sp.]|jgi:hypothetical protein|nr:hypothetical protein [Mesorhizobium sp.]
MDATELINEGAIAIYREWSRERDPVRARQRFDRLRPAIREQFEAEAKACFRTFEMLGMELRT